MITTADGAHLIFDSDDAGPSPHPSLDNQQYLAVTSPICATRVIAGPGAGKTRVITARTAYMVSELKVHPSTILAITFTNKAAGEMRNRIQRVLGASAAQELYAGTFHSWCARFLRTHCDEAELGRNYSIYDRDDTTALIASIMESRSGFHHNQLRAPQVVSYINSCKSRGDTVEQLAGPYLAREHDDSMAAVRARVWAEYERSLRRQNAVDFDDLLLRTLKTLEEHPDILRETADVYRHLLVDEYQDTCSTQQHLVNIIAQNHHEPSLFVVGDPDQSIYAFRHARVQGILDFQQAFPQTRTYFLTRNYRSTGRIIDASQEVIASNNARIERSALTTRSQGKDIFWIEGTTPEDEAAQIADYIAGHAADYGTPWGDFCIAYRTHAQSHYLAQALRDAHVPSYVASGYDFFNRAEIKAYLAWMRVAANKQDDAALRTAAVSPRRGVGRATMDRLGRLAQDEDQDLTTVIRNLADGFYDDQPDRIKRLRIRPAEMNALTDFQAAMETVQDMAEYASPLDIILHLSAHTGLGAFVENLEGDPEERRAFVQDLMDMADPDSYGPGQLTDFLESIAVERDRRGEPESDGIPRVTLTTLHQAKGLEFPVCIIASAHNQQLPHYMAKTPAEREEERRLFYVGMTRAKDDLVISWHTHSDNRRFQPSPYVYDIPANFWSFPLPE